MDVSSDLIKLTAVKLFALRNRAMRMGGESIGIVPKSVDEGCLIIEKWEPKDSCVVNRRAHPTNINAEKCLKLLKNMIQSNQMSSSLQQAHELCLM